MDWYLLAWKRAGEFYGRSRRKEYWMFTLFHFLVSLGLLLFALAIREMVNGTTALAIYSVYSLLAVIPSTSCSVRRLHDTDKSGWWLLVSAIPLVGLIVLVFLVLDGDPGTNGYGSDPKQPAKVSAADPLNSAPGEPVVFATNATELSTAASATPAPSFVATVEDYDAWNYHLAHRNPLARRPGTTIKDEYEQFMARRAKSRPPVPVGPPASVESSMA
jgi:uncharacterized membrane protein YhaH (DUF805 family)